MGRQRAAAANVFKEQNAARFQAKAPPPHAQPVAPIPPPPREHAQQEVTRKADAPDWLNNVAETPKDDGIPAQAATALGAPQYQAANVDEDFSLRDQVLTMEADALDIPILAVR